MNFPAGDRPGNRRYGLRLEVHWKLMRRRRVLYEGAGRTLDLSSDGVLFEAGRTLPVGGQIELSIAWPVPLDGGVPLKLAAFGRVVRTDKGRAAIRIARTEFRALAVPRRQPGTADAASTLSEALARSFGKSIRGDHDL